MDNLYTRMLPEEQWVSLKIFILKLAIFDDVPYIGIITI